MRKKADKSKNEYPEICEIIHKDNYVDDCLSGSSGETSTFKLSDKLQIVVNRGGFSLKGFTFICYPPCASSSSDGESVGVAGLRWYPEDDKVALDISELNFSMKYHGKKSSNKINTIPSKLTRRCCVSKVSEIYDLTGLITLITAGMKIDLHTLVQRKLNWDDAIPDDLRPLWETHFQMMQEIKNIKFNRAIIPKDAISLNINTVDIGDASKNIACAAIYARCERLNGQFSCQLIFSRSKVVPDSMSQPRAELFAAVLNAHTGERKYLQSSTKLTDSQTVLHWISNSDKSLKQCVRNRVIEIRRFTIPEQWRYVQSKDMIADMGTRKVVKTEQVDSAITLKEIQLDKDEIRTLKSEFIVYDTDNLLQLEWPIRNNNNGNFTYTAKECIRTSIPSEVLDIANSCFSLQIYSKVERKVTK